METIKHYKHINLFHVSEDLGVFCEVKIEERKLNA